MQKDTELCGDITHDNNIQFQNMYIILLFFGFLLYFTDNQLSKHTTQLNEIRMEKRTFEKLEKFSIHKNLNNLAILLLSFNFIFQETNFNNYSQFFPYIMLCYVIRTTDHTLDDILYLHSHLNLLLCLLANFQLCVLVSLNMFMRFIFCIHNHSFFQKIFVQHNELNSSTSEVCLYLFEIYGISFVYIL